MLRSLIFIEPPKIPSFCTLESREVPPYCPSCHVFHLTKPKHSHPESHINNLHFKKSRKNRISLSKFIEFFGYLKPILPHCAMDFMVSNFVHGFCDFPG